MNDLVVIDNSLGLSNLIDGLREPEFVSYDIETDGLAMNCNIIGISVCADESTAYYIILSKWDSLSNNLIPVLLDDPLIVTLLKLLQTKKLIMHNAVFDCSRTETFFKISLIEHLHTDTMVLAHLLDENRRVGLKELAKTLFGEDSSKEQDEMKASVLANGGKLTKTQYEMFKADAYIMGRYGAKDALLTLKLFYALIPDLIEQKLDSFFYDDESMPLLRGPTYQLNTAGLKVDLGALQSLKATLQTECVEAESFIRTEIEPYIKHKYPGTNKKNKFNIGSSQQLAWLLFGQLGLEFGHLTDAGNELRRSYNLKSYTGSEKRNFIATVTAEKGNTYYVMGKTKKVRDPWCYIACDKKTITSLSTRYEWVKRLLEFQRKNKILTTYVKGIESRIQYGVIRPNFLQTGTTSGRYASRDPNFQNLPRDDKRVKACIVSRPGKVFVGADYSQLEPRVFAYFSNDERLKKAFDGTSDFYSTVGMEVYDKLDCTPQKDGSPDAFGIKYKKLRDLSKVIALASTYGATARQLAPTTGKSIEDTQDDIDSYFNKFPRVRDFQLDCHKEAKSNGRILNLFGRPRRMPEAKGIKGNHEDLQYNERNLLNLAVNHRVQSTGASICNRASVKFLDNCKKANINAKLVIQVHDNLTAECDEADAETVGLLLQDAMETAVILEGVDLEAIPKIGKSLAEV